MYDACRVRIAVALTALRQKSREQSFESYVIDLQVQFPLRCSCPAQCVQDPTSAEPWRERALTLEKTLQNLQSQYDGEHAELIALRALPTPEAAAPCSAPIETSAKKRQKKKVSAQSARVPPVQDPLNTGDLLKGLNTSSALPELSISDGVLASLRVLDTLVTHTDCSSDADRDLIFLATERALGAFVKATNSMLPPQGSVSSHPDVFDSFSILLDRFLVTVVPLLRTTKKRNRSPNLKGRLDTFCGRLANELLAPLVCSFPAASREFLEAVLKPKTARPGTPRPSCDGRLKVLNFLRAAINALRQLCSDYPRDLSLLSSIQGVYERLMLSATHSLECLYPPSIDELSNPSIIGEPRMSTSRPPLRTPDGDSSAPQQFAPQTTDRLEKLARKDALWYLCSIMHLTITASSTCGPASSAPSALSSSLLPSGSSPSASASASASTSASSSSTSSTTLASAELKSMINTAETASACASQPGLPRGQPLQPIGTAAPQQARSPGHDAESSTTTLLAEGVYAALSALIRRMPPADSHAQPTTGAVAATSVRWRRQRREDLLDETERAMVLAVAEKLWLSQG